MQGQGSRQASGSEKAAGPAAGKASNQRLDKLRGAAHDHSLHSMETNADEESIMRLGVVVDSDRDYNKVRLAPLPKSDRLCLGCDHCNGHCQLAGSSRHSLATMPRESEVQILRASEFLCSGALLSNTCIIWHRLRSHMYTSTMSKRRPCIAGESRGAGGGQGCHERGVQPDCRQAE